MKITKTQLQELIREEIQNHLSLKKEVNEGIIKNLTLAALLAFPGLINAQPSINPVEKEKIVNVVQNNNELTFKSIEDFNKHFQKNIEQFKKLGASSRTNEITVVVDGVAYKGKIGLSKDMQMAVDKASTPGKNPNYRSSFKTGDSYVAYVLYKM
jgi:hypothetical protein